MRSTKKRRAKRAINNRIITSLFLTLIIIASLVLVNVQPASAVTLDLSFSPASQCSGRPITITATITINSSEMVPINNILLYIDGSEVANFNVDGSINTNGSEVISITGPGAPSYGYSLNRYGYGYGSQAGFIGDHYWNWGYGYGYGYGPITLTYTIVLNTSGMATGAHTARLRANLVSSADYFLSPVETFTIRTCGGGGGGGYSPTFTTDLCGSTNSWSILNTGVMRENVSVSCTDGNFSINISEGTKMLLNGSMLEGITMESMTPLPTSPEGYHVLNAFNFEPDGATFDPGFELTVNYDPASIPEGFSEENLVIGVYDDATGTWTYLTGTMDTENNTVTFTITHFTVFALMAAAIPPTPTPTATPTSTPTPTQTVAPTPTVTSTPTAAPTVPYGGSTSGKSNMPDNWVMMILAIAGGALLAGLVGAIIRRARS